MSVMDVIDTVVRMQFGSHLYGTSTPSSDLDYKAVHIPTARDIILQRTSRSIQTGPSKTVEGQKNQAGDVDEENYSLQYFLKLLADGQTGPIDMLFAPDSALLFTSDCWQTIRENKLKLLSRKSAAFVGYCRTQANKYGIKGSRMAAAKLASEFFTGIAERRPTEKVGDYQSELEELMCGNEHMALVTKDTTPGHQETYFECVDRLVGFKNTVKEAAGIYTKIYENYGQRARMALNNEGIDWKALSHAVRVGNEAIELLHTGNVTFPLMNASHLLDIKLGKLPYQVVAEEIEQLLVAVEWASEHSTLPEKADQSFIDALVETAYVSKIERYVNNQRAKIYCADDWGGINILGGGSVAE